MAMSATCVLHRLAIAQDSETRYVPIRITAGPYTPTPDGAKMHNLSCGTLDLRRQLPDRRLSNQSRRLRLSLCYVIWPVVHWDAKIQATAFSASLKTSFEDVVQRNRLSRRDIVVVNAGVHMESHKELLRKQVSSFVRSIDDHAANKPRVIWRETSPQFFSEGDRARPWLSKGSVCERRDNANAFNNITGPLLSHSSSIRVLRTWRLSNAAGGESMKGYSRVQGNRMALARLHAPVHAVDSARLMERVPLQGADRSRLAARRWLLNYKRPCMGAELLSLHWYFTDRGTSLGIS